MIFCLKCGSKKVRPYVSSDFAEYTCKACGFLLNVDLDGWEQDRYQMDEEDEVKDIPFGCLLVMSWEPE